MRSRLRLRDLSTEAIAGVMQRPGRTILTMLGTVMGVGSFVAVLGLTASATGQSPPIAIDRWATPLQSPLRRLGSVGDPGTP